jgi:hypothetical protein
MCVLSGAVAIAKAVVVVWHDLRVSDVKATMVFFAAVISVLDLIIFYVVRDAIFSSRLVVVSPNGSINDFAAANAVHRPRLSSDLDELAPLLQSQSAAIIHPSSASAAAAAAAATDALTRRSSVLAGEHTRAEERFVASQQQRRYSAGNSIRRESVDSADGGVFDELESDSAAVDDAETIFVPPPSGANVVAKPVRPSLARLCERMSRRDNGVSVGDRVDVFRTHKQCFIGSEAIDWMVVNVVHLFPTRRLALDVAQELLEQRFISSATCQCGEGECECVFRDSSRAFYRFAGHGVADASVPATTAPIEVAAVRADRAAPSSQGGSVPQSPAMMSGSLPAVAMTQMSQLQQIATYSARSVTVGDRLVQLSAKTGKRYLGVISGRALCDWFMATYMRHERYLAEKRVSHTEFRIGTPTGDALIGDEAIHHYLDARGSNRDASISLGQALLDERLLFHSTDGRRFVDSEVFFSFHPTQLEVLTFDEAAAPVRQPSNSSSSSSGTSQKARQFSAAELDGLARALSSPTGVKLSDRAYRLSDSETRSFKNVFAANDAVRWLVEHQLSKENAVRALTAMAEAGLIKHAANETKPFVAKDGEFYKFVIA